MSSTLFQNTSLAETAYTLREEWELAVIPLQPREKKPLVAWADFQAVLPSTEQVEAWWTKWPEANIGVICGPHSNLLVVDCDNAKAQEYAFEHFIRTPLTVTTSRGFHLYYKWPKNTPISALKQLKSDLKAKEIGLDLQISGNYVVGPVSKHPSGAIYTMIDYFGDSWLDDEVPEFMEIAPSASQNVDLSSLDLSFVKSRFGEIEHGDRNSAMTQFVGSLIAMGGAYPDVLREALEENQSRFVPPLPPKDIKTIVESVFRTHERNHGPTGNSPSKDPLMQIDTSDLRQAEVKEEISEPWPEKLLHPSGLLERIMNYTMDAYPRTERVFALAGSLTLLSTVMGQRVVTTTGLPTGLYTIIVGDSGTGKGGPLSAINRILHCDPMLANAYAGSDVASDAAIVNYLTREGCQRSLFVFDEIGMFLSSCKKATGNARANIVKMFTDMYAKRASEPYKKRYADEAYDRCVDWYSLSLFGATVPGELWQSLQDNETTNGFLARCMIFQEASSFKLPNIDHEDIDVPQDIVKGVLDLWKINEGNNKPEMLSDGGVNLHNVPKPIKIDFTTEAKAYHLEKLLELEHTKERYYNTNDQRYLSVYNRTGAKAWQVGLIHCGSRLGSAIVNSRIDLEDIQYGWELVEEVDRRMLKEVVDNVAQTPFEALTQKVIQAVQRKSVECKKNGIEPMGATFRDITRAIRTDTVKSLKEAIESLTHQGRLLITVKKPPRGREVAVYQIAEVVS